MELKKTKLHALSPRANYTDWAAASYQLLLIEDAMWSTWWIPVVVFSDF
jgi:hypothetical protein